MTANRETTHMRNNRREAATSKRQLQIRTFIFGAKTASRSKKSATRLQFGQTSRGNLR
jgi:hypothetical protein